MNTAVTRSLPLLAAMAFVSPSLVVDADIASPPGAGRSPAASIVPPDPLTLAEFGACNPRVEVCEGRAEDDERSDDAAGRERGWLAGAACNPRVRVCES